MRCTMRSLLWNPGAETMLRLAIVDTSERLPLYHQAAARIPHRTEITREVTKLDSADAISGLLRDIDAFDACVMLAPNAARHEHFDQLAAAKKHLLLSPHHSTPEFYEQLSAKFAETQAHLVLAQPSRFSSYAESIAESSRGEHLGNTGLIRIHRWMRTGTAGLQKQLWQACVEEIDLTCWLAESSPRHVFACQAKPDASSGTASFVIHLGFESGMAVIDCSTNLGTPYYSVSLIGSQGAAYADDHHNTNLVFGEKTLGINVHDAKTQQLQQLRGQLGFLADAIASDRLHQTVSETNLAIRVAHAAVQSASTGEVAIRNGVNYELQ